MTNTPFIVHQKHQFDEYPICWGIEEIVLYKSPVIESVTFVLANLPTQVTCAYCKNIAIGGRGKHVSYKPATEPPSLQSRHIIPGRQMRKRSGVM